MTFCITNLLPNENIEISFCRIFPYGRHRFLFFPWGPLLVLQLPVSRDSLQRRIVRVVNMADLDGQEQLILYVWILCLSRSWSEKSNVNCATSAEVSQELENCGSDRYIPVVLLSTILRKTCLLNSAQLAWSVYETYIPSRYQSFYTMDLQVKLNFKLNFKFENGNLNRLLKYFSAYG